MDKLDLSHLTPERQAEWHRAAAKVSHRQIGYIPGCTPAGKTPSLVNSLGLDPSADATKILRREMYLHRRESEAKRRGVKVARNERPRALEP